MRELNSVNFKLLYYTSLPPPLLVKVISSIKAQQFDLDEFKGVAGIRSHHVFKEVINFLYDNNIGRLSLKDRIIFFSGSDKIRIILIAIQMGCDIQTCSKFLTWQDFESLTSEILIQSDYETRVNIHLTKPRCQLDVVGLKNNSIISIDCKHWKYYSRSAIMPYIDKQITRTKNFLINNKKIKRALPMLTTLYDANFKLIGGVPIVPIRSFQSFLVEFETFEDKLLYISN